MTSEPSAATIPAPIAWEYVTTPLLLHQEAKILNNWGVDGWELVTVQPGPQGGLIAFLKRPAAGAAGAAQVGAR